MPITATAPGKLMLLGEHAVVYDAPCLVTAVGLRYRATITPHDEDRVVLDVPGLAAPRALSLAHIGRDAPPETAFVEAVIGRFRDEHGLGGGFTLATDGPALSYGLGSSSAVTAATAAALNALAGAGLDALGLFRLCYGAVLDVQGRGSGYDVASAIYGGTLYYRREGPVIERLEGAPPLVIGYSGSKVGTVGLVEGVAALRERLPALINPVFDTIGAAVEAGRGALVAGDVAALGEVVNVHAGLTDALGVNTGTLAALCYAARGAGALGAKLSGAGGGDCMYAVVTDAHRAHVEAAITGAGGAVVALATGAPGARVEPS